MTILYIVSQYSSHFRTAQAYCRIIGRWHSFVSRVDTADLVILHCEPHDYASLYRSYRLANKYVIAYAVWEADDLPDAYKRSLKFVQEVWVPSQYCKAAFERYHPRVFVVPHVLERESLVCSDLDRAGAQQMIQFDAACTYYFTITKVWDKRKNLQFVIDTFEELRSEMPRARLIVKTCDRDQPPRISDPRISVISATLTDHQIAGLYDCTDVYVSAHHSEGWGLTMADALLFGKPTVATGYSGNLEFMNCENSFLLAYKEEYIREEDVFGLFTDRMRWAYPSQSDLATKFLSLYGLRENRAVQQLVQSKLHGIASIKQFSSEEIGKILRLRLDECCRYGRHMLRKELE